MRQEARGQAAFVLHQRDWQDSGRVFELLTREHGRMSVFAQGIRGPKAKLAGVMRPFVPLLVSWIGRGDAPRLVGAELTAPAAAELPPGCVMPAFYLNELLLSLTTKHDPHPELFDHYARTLHALRQGSPLQRELRLFEKRLLETLGYGIPAMADAGEADPLGLERIPAAALESLAAESLEDPEIVEQVRPLLRRALALCLDGRGLRTRVVARSLKELQAAPRKLQGAGP